jgi:EAL domain-containing protein (putative c-di-GMP-specific phosphodiesterase class I)
MPVRGPLRRTVRRRALLRARNALHVVFQPICCLDRDETVGYEAFSRFPDQAPEIWFEEARALGRSVDLEMRAVLGAMADADPSWGYVSMNVSPQLVMSPAFIGFALGLPKPERLVLELTEPTAVGDDDDGLCTGTTRLRGAGVRLAVGDTGISSSDRVLKFAPDIIKLDRALIADLDIDARRRASVQAIVALADRIDASVVAVGIEREEQRIAALELGVRFGQGYLLGRPVHPTNLHPPSGPHR